MTKLTYEKSVNILLDAYNKESLFHGNCQTCAVGNLLDGCALWGYKYVTSDGRQIKDSTEFGNWYSHKIGDGKEKWSVKEREEYLNTLVQSKGLTHEELAGIEYVFESSIWIKTDGESACEAYSRLQYEKQGQYLGLVAVLTLMETMVEEPVESAIDRLQMIAHDKYGVTV